jgi:hypothetical protein
VRETTGVTEQPATSAEGAGSTRRRRRWPVLVLALTVAVGVGAWSLMTSLVADVGHPGDQIERPSAEITGVDDGLTELHGHLNYVIWGDGEPRPGAFEETVEATLAETDDAELTTLVEDAQTLVQLDEHERAHATIERAERRLAELAS